MSLSKALEELYGQPGEFLRRLRSELLLHKRTRHALAREAGIDHSNVYKYFSGEIVPNVNTMVRLDEAMERLLND
jgi:transcriptional regulator with XRE-family HTH domain